MAGDKAAPRLNATQLERALRERAAAARARTVSLKGEVAAEAEEKAELDRRFKDAVRRRDEISGWVDKKEQELKDSTEAYDAKVKARPMALLRMFTGKAYEAELEELFDEVESLKEKVNIGQAQLGDAKIHMQWAKADRADFKPRPPEERLEEERTFERHAKLALLAVTRIPMMQVGEGITLKQALERSNLIGQRPKA